MTRGAYLEQLNQEQREAVNHFEGPLLVLAGAGSGKTRVLTTRIAHLIQERGVPPDRILAVTFTNKAAGELRDRISSLLGEAPKGMWAGTFHALGARMLRRHAPLLGWSNTFTIFDAEQSLRLIKRTTEDVGLDTRRWSPKAIRGHLSAAKNQLIGPQQFVEENAEGLDVFARNVAKVYPAYQRSLRAQNAFDFDDLLVKPVELLESNADLLEMYQSRFHFLLVDEYQDTNRAQFRFVELLASEHRNLMVVGDDDQSIYGWRGADIRNILDFETAFVGAHTVRLEQNYRSTEVILSAANAVIAENVDRKGKTLRTDRMGGERITLVTTSSETDEARWIADQIEARVSDGPGLAYREMAILYRTNAQSRALEDVFRRRGLRYQIVGGVRFYERREIQDVLAYLRLISNPLDAGAFERVVSYPRRGVGNTSLERLSAWAKAEEISLLEAAARADEAPEVPKGGVRGLGAFAALIQRHSALASQMRVGELLERLVEELDLFRHLADEGPEGEDRADNVRELIASALDYNSELEQEFEEETLDHFTELDLFLQQVALVADVDRHDPDADAVTLMTLHNAKGLEFPVVFISGLEDGLFPLGRAYDNPSELEEERRLFYVGITRAKNKLYLTHARRRRRAGEVMFGRLSPFVDAIPPELVEKVTTAGVSEFAGYAGTRAVRPDTGGSIDLGLGDDDPAFDAGLNQDLPRFVKGEAVLHDTFGSGRVGEVTGFGRDLKVTIHFETVGTKRLLVRYAGLRRDFD
ncbi:MAG: UvrD-helicase domain-containing protein [Gemmatimonadetes bacterium]|nr:UvrD-helicase domain-containing protein [Gemmatimonadota bacterium]